MLSQIAYVRQQIQFAQRAGTPSARADHLQRALDGLARVESQASDFLDDCLRNHQRASNRPTDIAEDAPSDPFLPPIVCATCKGTGDCQTCPAVRLPGHQGCTHCMGTGKCFDCSGSGQDELREMIERAR